MKSEPTILSKFGRPVMFVIEREQNKRSEEAKRFWEVKSLEPTFLPKFGRPVMFVIEREQNKRSEEAVRERLSGD